MAKARKCEAGTTVALIKLVRWCLVIELRRVCCSY